MARINYRGNTQTSYIPLLTDLHGQSIIIPRTDNTYLPGVNPPDNAVPSDRGIPQIYYGHNIMPSISGIQSIGYNNIYAPITEDFLSIIYVPSTNNNRRTYLAVTASGTIYCLSDGVWRSTTGATTTTNTQLSVATINGVSYICLSNTATYTFDLSTRAFTAVTLKGLTSTEIIGILASKGYMIAYSKTGVNWSSTTDPLDFTPSLETGAGGGNLQEAKGDIIWIQESTNGMYVFTDSNIVAGGYSGNINFPWTFKEVQSAGGISDPSMVVPDSSGQLYCYTSSGLQLIKNLVASPVLPYVTDFLGGKIFEDFNEATGQLVRYTLSSPMRKRLTLVADRYLILSYGLDTEEDFSHAIVVDTVQSRQGKLKIPHTQIFERKDLSNNKADIPRDSIGILQSDGTVKSVDFNLHLVNSQGVAIFGRYQLVREREIELHEVVLDSVESDEDVTVTAWGTQNGRDIIISEEGYILPGSNGIQTYLFSKISSRNVSLVVRGSFNIISLLLSITPSGSS